MRFSEGLAIADPRRGKGVNARDQVYALGGLISAFRGTTLGSHFESEKEILRAQGSPAPQAFFSGARRGVLRGRPVRPPDSAKKGVL